MAEQKDTSAYWGDTHQHSDVSPCGGPEGKLSPAETFALMRDEYRHDFLFLTDHDQAIHDEQWEEIKAAAESETRPGTFSAFPGYEFTTEIFGHYNVFWKDGTAESVVIRTGDKPLVFGRRHPRELLQRLEPFADRVVVSACHPAMDACPNTWRVRHPLLRLAELCYAGGTFEAREAPLAIPGKARLYVQDALISGHRVSFIGGTDTHKLRSTGQEFHSLTGILAAENTPEALFAALKAGRTCAAVKCRTEVDLSISGTPMGGACSFTLDTMEEMFPLEIRAAIRPTVPLTHVELIHNGEVMDRKTFQSQETEPLTFSYTYENPYIWNSFTNCYDHFFYLRVRHEHGAIAFSSPVWVLFHAPGE